MQLNAPTVRPESDVLSALLQPIQVGGVTAPNRVVLCPMTSCFADEDGFVSDRMIAFLEARARGGAGIVMTEGAAVHSVGRGWKHHFKHL